MKVIEKINLIKKFRSKLNKKYVLSGWMQICSPEIAEILSKKNFDTITLDFEHGSFDLHRLNDIFRAIECENKVSLVRLPNHKTEILGQIFDSGCDGVIIPNVTNPFQVENIAKNCNWPPSGKRGVGFSRANTYGKYFNDYKLIRPIIIAMIENIKSIKNLDNILKLKTLDAILIGPYDLSASLGKPGAFNNKNFIRAVNEIKKKCKKFKKPVGLHLVDPSTNLLKKRIKEGFKFLPFGIDTVLLNKSLDSIS